MTYYYLLFTIFALTVYAITVDENVAHVIILLLKILKLNVERAYWMIILHPKNPITNLKRKWEFDKIAKELHNELVKSQDLSYNKVVIEDSEYEQNSQKHRGTK